VKGEGVWPAEISEVMSEAVFESVSLCVSELTAIDLIVIAVSISDS
jgi:hypothetical protein